jgi:hypothetical protein
MSRAARRTGSIHTRMAKFWAPMIWASATPSMVAMRGRMMRSRYSVTWVPLMRGFCTARYMMANCRPVPFWITGSSESGGRSPRTCWTFEMTSVRAASGSEPSTICTVTVERLGRLDEVT